jgi:hypothetical protein
MSDRRGAPLLDLLVQAEGYGVELEARAVPGVPRAGQRGARLAVERPTAPGPAAAIDGAAVAQPVPEEAAKGFDVSGEPDHPLRLRPLASPLSGVVWLRKVLKFLARYGLRSVDDREARLLP